MPYEVQVYICRVQDVPRDWEDQIDLLPTSYRAIARSQAPELKRKRAFCGGWLLNHIFGPRRVGEIKKDHLGKPYLPSSQVEFSMSHGGDNGLSSTFWMKNGNYLRLKDFQIGYTLPKSVLSALHIERIRFFVEGSNLFTIDSLPEGIDPESPRVNNGYYPQQRTFLGGVNITF